MNHYDSEKMSFKAPLEILESNASHLSQISLREEWT